jgi:hypothetical protein
MSASAVNLTASDGGLESCLALSQVPAEVGAHLKNALKLTSLKDFVHIVSKRDFERELKVIVEAIPGATHALVGRKDPGRIQGRPGRPGTGCRPC